MIDFMLGECWYDGELGVSGHPPQQEADIKDQPRVSTQKKDEQAVFPKEAKLHQLYNKMMQIFLCLICGKHSALCI